MTHYIIRRLMVGVASVVLLSLAVFTVLRVMPGDPTCDANFISKEQCQALRQEKGLDKPYFPISLDTSSGSDAWVVAIGAAAVAVSALALAHRRTGRA